MISFRTFYEFIKIHESCIRPDLQNTEGVSSQILKKKLFDRDKLAHVIMLFHTVLTDVGST